VECLWDACRRDGGLRPVHRPTGLRLWPGRDLTHRRRVPTGALRHRWIVTVYAVSRGSVREWRWCGCGGVLWAVCGGAGP
jgi:hypothetical protein